jgi:hypothetical protein
MDCAKLICAAVNRQMRHGRRARLGWLVIAAPKCLESAKFFNLLISDLLIRQIAL